MSTKKKPSAASRIKSKGKSLVWVTFTEAEKSSIRAAAGIVGKPMSAFVIATAISEAEKILKNFQKKGLTQTL